jgi:uncharacterized protein
MNHFFQKTVCGGLLQIFLFSALFFVGCKSSDHDSGKGNHLVGETSPYLLLHAHNPVDWYPWGEKALEKAKKEDKILIISIGYAACHWCHVMERESFMDQEVAELMNKHFVSIKVDREERPDIDQIYMNALQLVEGQGGWPLNAFALPDGRPFYAGTYYTRDEWLRLLEQIIEMYKDNKNTIIAGAESLTEGIKTSELVAFERNKSPIDSQVINKVIATFMKEADTIMGGFNRVPRFPIPVAWQFVLDFNSSTRGSRVDSIMMLTLDKMAMGGIYDQVGGGFARYSVDGSWKVPHFEKMLYDNAQLTSLYANAYRASGNEYYKRITRQTLEFIERDLSGKEGCFFSALDAESEGEEGKYYVWTHDEMKRLVDDKYWNWVKEWYSLAPEGNWEEGKNILYLTERPDLFFNQRKIQVSEGFGIVDQINKRLLEERRKRIRPALDDKVLCSWNALTSKAYVDAYRAIGDPHYLEKAIKNGEFIWNKMRMADGGLYRNYKDGKTSIPGFLDDYAFSIDLYFELYQVTFEEKWLDKALSLLEYTEKHFSDKESQMFFYTSTKGEKLIARKMEIYDNVMPSSNSVMAMNLYKLGSFYDGTERVKRSEQMLTNVISRMDEEASFLGNWSRLALLFAHGHLEVAIMGPKAADLRSSLEAYYAPNIFFMGGKSEGKIPLLEGKLPDDGITMIYVCRNKTCRLPVESDKEALAQIKESIN